MSLSVRCATVAALAVVATVAIGCGDTVIDSSKAEDAIQSNLEKSFRLEIASVSCPSNQEVEPGTTFTCRVIYKSSDLNGKGAVATLKILNEDADVRLVNLIQDKK